MRGLGVNEVGVCLLFFDNDFKSAAYGVGGAYGLALGAPATGLCLDYSHNVLHHY